MKKFAAIVLAMLMLVSVVGAQAMTAGTYEAAAKGFHGDVKIAVTVDENAITAIEVLEQSETEGIGTPVYEPLIKQALETQSAQLDTVSGATVTCNAFMEALANAMTKAGL